MFLYTNNKLSEREIKKNLLFYNPSKRIKYLGINLAKDVKGLYTKNYETLMKKLKTLINGKIFHTHGLEELILIKCPYYSKQSKDSVQFLTNQQWHFSQN